jgi:hypothetical protein
VRRCYQEGLKITKTPIVMPEEHKEKGKIRWNIEIYLGKKE